AIGIVVDDAIVVVENIERDLDLGLSAREAARHTMTEVGAALVSIALVLVAVFIPTAFLGGITGAFFRQFGVTIAGATVISALVSLTLSPALGAILLRPGNAPPDAIDRWLGRLLGPVFRAFNAGFDGVRRAYGRAVRTVVAHPGVSLVAFALLLAATAGLFRVAATGFIPVQDQGYLITLVELPKGSSLARTKEVVQEATRIIKDTTGTAHTVAFAGFSVATGANQAQSGTIFIGLKPYAERGRALGAQAIASQLNQAFARIQDAQLIVIMPPSVRGIGTGADFKMMVEDRSGQGLPALEAATWQLAGAAAQSGKAARTFTTFSNNSPEYFIDIDRTRAEMLDVPVENVFETLQVYLGSAYVNDFTLFGRNYRVTAQADAPFRLTPENVSRLETRNRSGEMVPLGAITSLRTSAGPDRVVRHNSYPAAELQLGTPPGMSSGDVLVAMEGLAREVLPQGFGYDWTELAFQQRLGSGTGLFMFPLSVLFVFLVLTAQYESWSLPFAIVLIVPLCLLFAVAALLLRGMDVNILAQIGFIVLVGLASKNAILIVEFARQKQEAGLDPATAAVEAAEIRLRPILMTSLAFIFGVLPLALASGAAAEMRRALGTVVVGGMLGVTIIGLFLTPVFFTVIRGWLVRRQPPATGTPAG
ncbi:MAG: efflux RND transporter permease subunit, partial [Gammaproteobacteria bacterium]|nr:efflux RND transporter permease subunit [Gammaproteobacteria bacterium]